MNWKHLLISAVVIFALGAAIGRYTVLEKVRIETKVVTVEKTVTDESKKTKTETDRDRHRETIVTEITHPDGRVEKTTRTVDHTETKRKTDQDTKTEITQDKTEVTEKTEERVRGSSPVTVSALVGAPISFSNGSLLGPIVYGAHISKPLLGPISTGLWGLTPGVFGVSVGLVF